MRVQSHIRSYPVVDGDKTNAENSSIIVIERNKAQYGSRTTLCEEVLEINDYYTQIITDYETGKRENHQHAKPANNKHHAMEPRQPGI